MQTPGIRYVRHESDVDFWAIASRGPHQALDGQILRYAGYVERSSPPFRRVEPACSHVVLILSFGDRLRLVDAEGTEATHTSFTGGVSDGPTFTEHPGRQFGIQVDLTPPAARALLGMPLRELTNRVVPLTAVLGPRADALIERLHEAPDWSARFAVLDEALGRRLQDGPRVPPAIAHAWRRLRASGGRIEIGWLAHELGYSRRRLTALFSQELGLPPKAFARVFRFERAAAQLGRDDGGRFAEIAHGCGYYDQAHLNRDFREFAGSSPGHYVARLLPDEGGVAVGEDVPFVQDARPKGA